MKINLKGEGGRVLYWTLKKFLFFAHIKSRGMWSKKMSFSGLACKTKKKTHPDDPLFHMAVLFHSNSIPLRKNKSLQENIPQIHKRYINLQ